MRRCLSAPVRRVPGHPPGRIQHAAQAKQVRPRIDAAAAGLFWRHVLRSSGNDSGSREAGVIDGTSQPEVGQQREFDCALVISVPMNQLLLSGVEKRAFWKRQIDASPNSAVGLAK